MEHQIENRVETDNETNVISSGSNGIKGNGQERENSLSRGYSTDPFSHSPLTTRKSEGPIVPLK